MNVSLKKFLAVNRWRVQLGYATIGVFGMGMVIAKTIQDIIKPYYYMPMWMLFPLGCVALWLGGFLYDKLGFYSNEMDYASKRNPFYTENFKKIHESMEKKE